MGSASSKRLVCPDGYDNKQFGMILKLYDHLDSNGDQVIETLELKDIAELHIKNKKTELTKKQQQYTKDYEYDIQQEQLRYEKNKVDISIIHERNIEKINNSNISKDISIKNEIEKLDKMCENEKCQTFLNVVSADGKHIEFWKFFEYMKNKTGDIKNIDFN